MVVGRLVVICGRRKWGRGELLFNTCCVALSALLHYPAAEDEML